MGIHSRQEQCFTCTPCWQTCTTTQGTVFSRLRTSTETVTRVVTLLARECPWPAIGAACGMDERTVAVWLQRAGIQGDAVHAPGVELPGPWDRGKHRATGLTGCRVSGKAVTASACVGWCVCESCIQGGRPWKNLSAGRQPRSWSGACTVCSRLPTGISIC